MINTNRAIDGVAEPLLWNLRRLVDEYGAAGVRKVLDQMEALQSPTQAPLQEGATK